MYSCYFKIAIESLSNKIQKMFENDRKIRGNHVKSFAKFQNLREFFYIFWMSLENDAIAI